MLIRFIRWGRLIGSNQLDESNIGGTPSRPPWSSNFLGSKKKRRSRSVDLNESPRIERNVQRNCIMTEDASSKIIAEIVNNELRQSRRHK